MPCLSMLGHGLGALWLRLPYTLDPNPLLSTCSHSGCWHGWWADSRVGHAGNGRAGKARGSDGDG